MKKCKKRHTKTISLKYLLQYGMEKLNYSMDHILCLIFKITLSTSLKSLK